MTGNVTDLFYQINQMQGLLAPVKQRLTVLAELKKLLMLNQAQLIEAISADFRHRSTQETLLTEFFPLYQEMKFVAKNLKSWTKPRKQRTDFWYWPSKTKTQLQPLGTIGVIAPWNYPLFLSLSPLVAAIAAGNCCMVKLSEYTPNFGALLEKIIGNHLSHYGIAIVNGDVAVGEEFSRLPFDHLLFTGGTAIGKKVMTAASHNLTPVTLELGGKSPAIIDDKFDINEAANALMRGKLLNAGQICVAPDYLMLPARRLKEFTEAAKKVTTQFYPTLTTNTDYTCVINEKHWQRLKKLLDDAIAKGAEWVPLSEKIPDDCTTKFQPGLLLNVTDDMLVMQEEIFGPILPVKTYDEISEALAYINTHDNPLTLYAFTRNKSLQDKIVKQTLSGSVCFNEVLLQIVQNRIPFGGVGMSGCGQYRGRFGVETFSKLKPVYYQGRIHPTKLFAPPYGKVFSFMMKIMLP
jgi:acyl-CoA reductase-like NAD-dependent aldehyde dehydrogenase